MNITGATLNQSRMNYRSALMGAVVWMVLIVLPVDRFAPIGIIEKLFLLGALVVVPLGMALVSFLDAELRESPLLRVIAYLQPLAAIVVICSLWRLPGMLAGLLAIPWMLVCSLLALAGILAVRKNPSLDIPRVALLAGMIYLTGGAAWLILSRVGKNPMNFSEPIPLLTAVHFTFTGFAAPLIVAATGRRIRASSVLKKIYNLVALGSVLATPLIAIGFVFSPIIKVLSIVMLILSLHGLAFIFFWLLPTIPQSMGKIFLVIAGLSIFSGMIFAGMYGVGEYVGKLWISIPQMARTHGIINALGFSLCGIIGWLIISSKESEYQ